MRMKAIIFAVVAVLVVCSGIVWRDVFSQTPTPGSLAKNASAEPETLTARPGSVRQNYQMDYPDEADKIQTDVKVYSSFSLLSAMLKAPKGLHFVPFSKDDYCDIETSPTELPGLTQSLLAADRLKVDVLISRDSFGSLIPRLEGNLAGQGQGGAGGEGCHWAGELAAKTTMWVKIYPAWLKKPTSSYTVSIMGGGLDSDIHMAVIEMTFEPALDGNTPVEISLDGGLGYQPQPENSGWWPKNRTRAKIISGAGEYTAGDASPLILKPTTKASAMLISGNLVEKVTVKINVPSKNMSGEFPVNIIKGDCDIDMGQNALPFDKWHPVKIDRTIDKKPIPDHKHLAFIATVTLEDGTVISARKSDGTFQFLDSYVQVGQDGNHHNHRYHELVTDKNGRMKTDIKLVDQRVMNVTFGIADLEVADAPPTAETLGP